MKSIISAAIRGRRVTLFFALILAITGLVSYQIVPKQENPDVSAPGAIITTIYPGALPEEVAKLVSKKIEDNITDIEGFDNMETTSKKGISNILVFLDIDADTDKAWDELKDRVDEIKQDLPDGSFEPLINTNISETAGIIISLSGDKYSYEQLEAYADEFKRELRRVDGVSRFEIVGEVEKEVKVEVNAQKLNQYALSLEDIVNILKAQNVEIPSGSIEFEDGKIDVITQGNFTSIKEIGNTILGGSAENGSVIRLGDISDIYMDLEDGTEKFKQDGKNAVLLTGYFKDNENVVPIGKEVRERLEVIKKGYSEDLIIHEVSFQPEDVDRSVTDFVMNLLQGIIFVIIVVFIVVGFRNAIVVSTAIPLSMLLTFNMMNLLDIKIHFMSTAGLIIALGMLVDNAIVVSDAIQVNLDEGMDKFKAVVEGTSRSSIPILTSTLTTIAAFMPLLLLPGAPGKFVGDIPKIVILTLSNSYLVAMLVTPVMAYLVFKPRIGKKVATKGIVKRFFVNLLDISLKHKKKTLVLVLILFILTTRLVGVIGLRFMPFADKNILYLEITSEVAGDMDATENLVMKVEGILKENPEVTSLTTSIGDGLPKFYISMLPAVPSKDYGQIMLRFDLEKGERFIQKEELTTFLQEEMDSRIKGGKAIVKMLEYGKPIGHPVRIRILGDDYSSIYKDVQLIQRELEKIPGTMNVENDASDKTFIYSVETDNDFLRRYGLSRYDIQKQVNIALKGTKASTYRKAGNEYDIVVESNVDTLKQLENLKIKSSMLGNRVLLKQFADIKLEAQIDTLRNYNGDLNIMVTSDVKHGYSGVEIENILEEKISKMNLVNEVVFDGEREEIERNFGSMKILFMLTIILVYSILLIQFNSFVNPLIILITIPMSIIGIFNGLFLAGKPLSFMVMLGIISLAGVVVNNGILLIEYINDARRAGYSVEEACKDAVGKRFRPIISTTMTTVIGLVPLYLSGNPLFEGMSIALMSGLLISMVLTMIIIPTIYAIVTKDKKISEEIAN
ncbi:efflux RND transporter permease subunit [Wukongibacter baidiensis]|uniref:efflux RND transporter permease subunit n=1 Tax=Wukongibacter baidiensis TaxID=1723361 RepID=UPI003D7FBDF3